MISGVATSSWLSSSTATPPQLKPPALPGNTNVPSTDGGVK